MSQQEKRIGDSKFSGQVDGGGAPDDGFEGARLAALRVLAVQQAGAGIARRLNGPLTALLFRLREIRQYSRQFFVGAEDRVHLHQVVDRAFRQAERVRAMVEQMADRREAGGATPALRTGPPTRPVPSDGSRAAGAMFSPGAGRKPLTRREREVVSLISEGRSNKQGALLMRISPRTFECHRAEAMRKLGARNTAELVRSALLDSSTGDVHAGSATADEAAVQRKSSRKA